MNSFIFILLFSVMGCAKVNYQHKPIEVSIPKDMDNGYMVLSFANHATIRDYEEEYSRYMFNESLIVELPDEVKSISFNSSFIKPSLGVYYNDVKICSYNYVLGKYVSNCNNSLTIKAFDVITIKGIPRSNTITLRLAYMRNL